MRAADQAHDVCERVVFFSTLEEAESAVSRTVAVSARRAQCESPRDRR